MPCWLTPSVNAVLGAFRNSCDDVAIGAVRAATVCGGGMLKQRVITAIGLLAVFVPALFYPNSVPFGVLTLSLMIASGWEWARLNGCSPLAALFSGGALGAVLAAAWAIWGVSMPAPLVWQLAALIWVVITVWLLRRGVSGWSAVPSVLRLGGGWLSIGLAWWAMVQAMAQGVSLLLSILCLVWMADSAAYFGGKAFGRRKLAPTISPGKSWAGVYSGMAGVLLLGGLWVWIEMRWGVSGSSLFGRLWAQGPWAFVAGLLGLTAMGVAGDLLESLVKRSAGVKDSSALLPGHGGVLDRVDALLPVLPLAMWLITP